MTWNFPADPRQLPQHIFDAAYTDADPPIDVTRDLANVVSHLRGCCHPVMRCSADCSGCLGCFGELGPLGPPRIEHDRFHATRAPLKRPAGLNAIKARVPLRLTNKGLRAAAPPHQPGTAIVPWTPSGSPSVPPAAPMQPMDAMAVMQQMLAAFAPPPSPPNELQLQLFPRRPAAPTASPPASPPAIGDSPAGPALPAAAPDAAAAAPTPPNEDAAAAADGDEDAVLQAIETLAAGSAKGELPRKGKGKGKGKGKKGKGKSAIKGKSKTGAGKGKTAAKGTAKPKAKGKGKAKAKAKVKPKGKAAAKRGQMALGCSKCRYLPNGCGTCRDPNFTGRRGKP